MLNSRLRRRAACLFKEATCELHIVLLLHSANVRANEDCFRFLEMWRLGVRELHTQTLTKPSKPFSCNLVSARSAVSCLS